MSEDIATVLVVGIPAILGIRSTLVIWGIVLFDHQVGLNPVRALRTIVAEFPRNPILVGLALISTIITIAALWFGVLTVRRALGFEPIPIDISIPVGLILAALVLLIPTGIERLVAYISTSRGRAGR